MAARIDTRLDAMVEEIHDIEAACFGPSPTASGRKRLVNMGLERLTRSFQNPTFWKRDAQCFIDCLESVSGLAASLQTQPTTKRLQKLRAIMARRVLQRRNVDDHVGYRAVEMVV